MEQGIHGRLKCGRSITESERHHHILVVALMSTESCLKYVMLDHVDLVEALCQVHFRKPRGMPQIIEKFINGSEGKSVFDGDGVQGPIVDVEPPCVILLFYQQYRR